MKLQRFKDMPYCWRVFTKYLTFELSLTSEFGFKFGWDKDDDNFTLHLCFPFIRTFISTDLFYAKTYKDMKETYIQFCGNTKSFSWRINQDSHSWKSSTSKFLDNYICFENIIFGKQQFSRKELETKMISIPMPEHNYNAKVTLYEDTWKYKRWFTQKVKRGEIKLDTPIPIPGKGENSWDCGDDAVYEGTYLGNSIPEVVGRCITNILQTRVRRGGYSDWNWNDRDKI